MYFNCIYFFNLSLVTTSYTYGKPDLLLFSRFIVHKVRLHIFKKLNKVFHVLFWCRVKKKVTKKDRSTRKKRSFFLKGCKPDTHRLTLFETKSSSFQLISSCH